jgi:uncharacterized membrane protein YkvI
MSARPTWFQRFLLPGFAFKAVVIGGGYATGRELAEFFLPGGPWGGLFGMVLAMLVWSVVCTATFLLARTLGAQDYRSFFKGLLGPFWGVFEVAFGLSVIVLLAVFGSAAGAIGQALFGWPTLVGALLLMGGIAFFATFGNSSVERLFKWVSFILYGVYALFVALALSRFGGRVLDHFATAAPPAGDWALGGVTYAGYNILGAVVILPVTRHMLSRRDAVVAGLLAGPLAMAPALLFFICMIAYYPEIGAQALPSDFLLQRLQLPAFHALFQLMIFSALLESGAGAVHAINERIASAYRRRGELSNRARLTISASLLVGSVFLAQRFGLVALIATGYRALAYVFLAIYVLPLMTFGLWTLWRARAPGGPAADRAEAPAE